MPIEQALTVVDRRGNIIFDAGPNGVADGSGRQGYNALEKTAELNAASIDKPIFTCVEGIWRLLRVASYHLVAGGAGAALTLVYCPGSGTVAAGTPQLTAAFDLTVTAPALRFGTLIATPNQLFPGDSLCLDFSGTLTGLSGLVTVQLGRIG